MHCIWAVAVNTIRQALRIRVAVVFMLLLAVLLPIMAASMTGDGTIKGRLQTFASYGLSLTSLLLCLLTIIVATFTLTDDIKNKQIYTVITKPIARFQFILGKLLGVLMLDIALLVFFSAIIYSITLYIPKYFNASEKDLSQLRNEFFTARAGLKPQQPDMTKEVLETYEKLEKSFQLPAGVAENKIAKKNYIRALTRRKELEKRAAVP
ncbi:MAG: ABC transporter permease, partial [Planctomycetota bacterium]